MKFAFTTELLSWPGRIRAGIGSFLGHFSPPEGKEETIREWVTRTLGEEVYLRCICPFVSGVYAGDPETLSMQAALPKINSIEKIAYSLDWNKFGAIFYGGLKRQVELTKERKADPPDPAWPEFEYGNPGSFTEGLSMLPNAILKDLGEKVKLEWKLTKLEKAKSGDGFIATYDTPFGSKTVNAKSVLPTAPAHALQDVLESIMPEAPSIFGKVRKAIDRVGIYHPPVCAATVAYQKP